MVVTGFSKSRRHIGQRSSSSTSSIEGPGDLILPSLFSEMCGLGLGLGSLGVATRMDCEVLELISCWRLSPLRDIRRDLLGGSCEAKGIDVAVSNDQNAATHLCIFHICEGRNRYRQHPAPAYFISMHAITQQSTKSIFNLRLCPNDMSSKPKALAMEILISRHNLNTST